ncbi:hypothetical protein [Amycolatopsis sp. BJA-103]|uniref:hypothetical protein n=1 Tax=Amycolatopsis sp. BJA-103 TaxID=1911175 RepID=UPI000CA1308B|nr:hypothetical protein [Amycolatopsis sp. BJA-103]AUI57253.1 hypothetical protein BKN51_02865 [Amycolatopsis sp. BJA-103]PNE15532.1 hypothetical protein B1H26_31250 [Amycolatopsis sp. BJA-103]
MILGGPDSRTWVWEQALNIFSSEPNFPVVPSREDIIKKTWLSWGTHTHIRGPSNKVPTNLLHAEIMTAYTSYYATADATPEMTELAATYSANIDKIVNSLRDDSNDIGKRATFERAATTLGGAANLLFEQLYPLQTWRDKTGHRGDDFQGTGAEAFWTVLDKLTHRCVNLIEQLSRERASWVALRDAKQLMEHFAGYLNDGREMWEGDNSFTYDTGLGFPVTATGRDLSTPVGVIRAIWQAPALVKDINSHEAYSYYADAVGDNTPASKILGGKFSETGPREKLELAAKRVWGEHLVLVDSWGASAVGLLEAAYWTARQYLPEIRTPVYLNLSGGSGGGGGTGDGGPGDSGPGPGGGDGPAKDEGPVVTEKSTAPPPPPPPFIKTGPPPPPPVPGGPNPFLKVPTGSYVGPDGVVIGPDGKPVLGPDGRPIIVPPGSRVSGNGEIIGPRGAGNLEQKDRLRKPYPPPEGVRKTYNGESALERHLKSLRRTPPPQLPPLRAPDSLPITMSRYDPQSNFHSGPGSLGGGRSGVSPEVPSPGGKTVTPPAAGQGPLGGPKGTSGNGVPFYPPTAGGPGGAGQGKGERDRTTWLAEDEETWGTDPTVAPGVLGRRRRRSRAGVQQSTNPERDYTFGLGQKPAAGHGTGTTTG